MEKHDFKKLYISISALLAFVLWTLAVCYIDVRAIGPLGSSVGFSSVNAFIHRLTGEHLMLYYITDWLGLVPIFVVSGFALLGLLQWIKRKSLRRVDHSLFILGGFYIAVMAAYLLFEVVPINYRPLLIDGALEASYPSSTTLLVMSVMPAAIDQFNGRIKNKSLRKWISILIGVFVSFMVLARLISGVHWFTDIVGGVLISVGLVMMYRYFLSLEG